ncbi:hypothetical protein AWR27_23435 [Spirosoma montaniterrae]|uniref:Uncharacterized protein n=2 Tax=Spirosoma montaniterrae TaxID=1178516 RepID=A0A1P9X2Z6_9BACT|nr:hypothetical protein AWR27_23435 [Spirosoma montaniterrae]
MKNMTSFSSISTLFHLPRRRFVQLAAIWPMLLIIYFSTPSATWAQGVIIGRPPGNHPGRPPGNHPGVHPGRPPGRPPLWQDLGTTVVSYGVSRDAVNVFHEGFFRALKFRVWDAPLEMFEAEVVYGNGGRDRVPINQIIRRGEESSALNLRGDRDVFEKCFLRTVLCRVSLAVGRK